MVKSEPMSADAEREDEIQYGASEVAKDEISETYVLRLLHVKPQSISQINIAQVPQSPQESLQDLRILYSV